MRKKCRNGKTTSYQCTFHAPYKVINLSITFNLFSANAFSENKERAKIVTFTFKLSFSCWREH